MNLKIKYSNKKNENVSFGTLTLDNYHLAIEYGKAIKTLIESKNQNDSYINPLMFLIRHYIELLLKMNVEYFSKELNISKYDRTLTEHNLNNLLNAFNDVFCKMVSNEKLNYSVTYRKDIDEMCKLLSEFLKLLIKWDNNSFSFRYMHNRKGERLFNETLNINIDEFIKKLDKINPLLLYSIEIFESES